MFKIHPDNDRLFARVLAASPGSRLVLFSARHPAVTDRYMKRLAGELAGFGIDVRARVIVLPLMSHDDYLRVNRLCDFALDTLYWSGGNTSLDALASGLPIVTHPGEFMRGRQSAAMLRLMRVDELIARDRDDYVSIASRLADDPAWRMGLARRIAEGRVNVFDDSTPPAAFAAAIEQRVRSVSSVHRPP
jgi:CRISPR-associated protein Csy1